MKPERIIPKWALALLGICFTALLLLLVWVACYAQPAKDDYYSYALFRDKNLWQSLAAQYQTSNGRLVSAFLMRFSPLQYHSFSGYQLVCAAFVLLFAFSSWWFINAKLRALHPADRLAVFFASFICFHAALQSFAEFYYWLPAISCYGIGALFLFKLLWLIPKNAGGSSNNFYFLLACISAFLMPLCSEVGTVMAMAALAIHTYGNKDLRYKRKLLLLLFLVLAGTAIAALSPGNSGRLAAAHYPRNLFLIAGAGLYTTVCDLFRFLFYSLPASFVAWIIFKRNYLLSLDKRKLLFLMGIIFLLWLLGETATCYALGGLPALRIRNSFLLFAWIIIPTAVSLCIRIEKRKGSLPEKRFATGMVSVWILSMFLVLNGPIHKATEDLIAGVPQRYDRQMKQVYSEALSGNEVFKKVSTVKEIPLSLFIEQPLIIAKDTSSWPYFNVYMALYFGHERLYADTLARVPEPDAALRERMMNFRK